VSGCARHRDGSGQWSVQLSGRGMGVERVGRRDGVRCRCIRVGEKEGYIGNTPPNQCTTISVIACVSTTTVYRHVYRLLLVDQHP
jgi:hypothetical protein